MFPGETSQDVLCAIGETAASGEVGDPRVAAALEVMRLEHANADLRLDDIARRVRLSKWHLNRLLTRHTGWGFLQHMREIRLSRAEYLLAGTKLAIKEIAFSVGYKYVNELDRHFMAKHGMTPSSYRKQCSTAAGLPSPVKSDEIRSTSPRE